MRVLPTPALRGPCGFGLATQHGYPAPPLNGGAPPPGRQRPARLRLSPTAGTARTHVSEPGEHGALTLDSDLQGGCADGSSSEGAVHRGAALRGQSSRTMARMLSRSSDPHTSPASDPWLSPCSPPRLLPSSVPRWLCGVPDVLPRNYLSASSVQRRCVTPPSSIVFPRLTRPQACSSQGLCGPRGNAARPCVRSSPVPLSRPFIE